VQIQQNQHYPSVDHPSMPFCTYIHIFVQRTLFCIQIKNCKYSQPLLSAILFCSFLLQWAGDIDTQNSLSTSKPKYCNSGSNKITYPGPVKTPSVASSPDHSHPPSTTIQKQWLSLLSPSFPTLPCLSCYFNQ